MGYQRATNFVAQLAKAPHFVSEDNVRNNFAHTAIEFEFVSVVKHALFRIGKVLSPPNGANYTAGAKMIRQQDVFTKDAVGPIETVKDIVHGDDGSIGKVRNKILEIGLGAGIGMVAIDPKETKRAVPAFSQFLGS